MGARGGIGLGRLVILAMLAVALAVSAVTPAFHPTEAGVPWSNWRRCADGAMGDWRSASVTRSRSPIAVNWAAKAAGGGVPDRRMRPVVGVVGDPAGDSGAGMAEAEEQGLVQEFIPHPSVERLADAVSRAACPGR